MTTARLNLNALDLSHASFLMELVNSPGWLEFIGERHVNSLQDAEKYVQKVLSQPGSAYWVVTLKDTEEPIGMITYIQRTYLPYRDIGFAFLPRYEKKGLAYEAAKSVIDLIIAQSALEQIMATTKTNNVNSIRLLEKLGLKFQQEIEIDQDTMLLFALHIEVDALDEGKFS